MALNHAGTVELRTGRLLLRRLREDDAEQMCENWAADPEVTKFLTWEPHRDVAETRAYLAGVAASYERPDSYHWGIELEGVLIGTIGVVKLESEDLACFVGYCMGRKWWGRGIMAEALIAVERFLFEEVAFNRIAAVHDGRNPNSGRVMRKAGMALEGVLRQSRLAKDGALSDTACYAILREEWKTRHG